MRQPTKKAIAPLEPEAINELSELSGDSGDSFGHEIAEIFVSHTRERLVEMNLLLHKKEYKAVQDLARSLRSASRKVGAKTLAHFFQTLEEISDWNRSADVVGQIAAEFERVQRELKELIKSAA
jgi:HPt (histidine-containing phosphotransfer) domain-containing protein